MTDTARPVLKTKTRTYEYFGARCVTTDEHHDKRPDGLRTITMEWLDDAAPENGGHRAGTITRRVIDGDGRRVDGTFHEIEPETVIRKAPAKRNTLKKGETAALASVIRAVQAACKRAKVDDYDGEAVLFLDALLAMTTSEAMTTDRAVAEAYGLDR